METIKIGETDIILQELGPGQGKIIIAHPYYNFSYYWGSMGSSLKEFLMDIDEGYFINKLEPINAEKPLNVKRTFANFRKQLYHDSDFGYNYPWYKEMEFQKELREEIKSTQDWVEDQYSFVDAMHRLPERISYYDIKNSSDRREVEDLIKSACCEPWLYIVLGESEEVRFLKRLFPKLKKEIKKLLKNQKEVCIS